jgi:D-tyrosyl-tRNA(Tyr) deacylase
MRVVIQRVKKASVTVNGKVKSAINKGLMILVGIEHADTDDDINWLCNKILQLRIFNDDKGIMNLSVMDSGGEILIVSQFTLHARTKKGNRPSYIRAASPEIAIPIYQKLIMTLSRLMMKEVHSGEFGAKMDIELINEGPVTIIIDSRNKE